MAARGQTYAEKTSRWEVLVINGRPEVVAMPHIGEDLDLLEGMLTEVRRLGSQQDAARADARELASRIQQIVKDGEKVRARLGALFRGKLGFESDTLVKFGFKPRPVGIRRRAKEKPAPTPAPGLEVSAAPTKG